MQGSHFLLIPETAAWWTTHFPTFTEHLVGRYQVVADEPGAGPLSTSAPDEVGTSRGPTRCRRRGSPGGRAAASPQCSTGRTRAWEPAAGGQRVHPPPGPSLPYADASVDVVVVDDPVRLGEATRIATLAVVTGGGPMAHGRGRRARADGVAARRPAWFVVADPDHDPAGAPSSRNGPRTNATPTSRSAPMSRQSRGVRDRRRRRRWRAPAPVPLRRGPPHLPSGDRAGAVGRQGPAATAPSRRPADRVRRRLVGRHRRRVDRSLRHGTSTSATPGGRGLLFVAWPPSRSPRSTGAVRRRPLRVVRRRVGRRIASRLPARGRRPPAGGTHTRASRIRPRRCAAAGGRPPADPAAARPMQTWRGLLAHGRRRRADRGRGRMRRTCWCHRPACRSSTATAAPSGSISLIRSLLDDGWSVTFLADEETPDERHAHRLRQLGVATFAGSDYASDVIAHGRFDLAVRRVLAAVRPPPARCSASTSPRHQSRSSTRSTFISSATPAASFGVDGRLDERYGSEMVEELNTYHAADAVLAVSDQGGRAPRRLPRCPIGCTTWRSATARPLDHPVRGAPRDVVRRQLPPPAQRRGRGVPLPRRPASASIPPCWPHIRSRSSATGSTTRSGPTPPDCAGSPDGRLGPVRRALRRARPCLPSCRCSTAPA